MFSKSCLIWYLFAKTRKIYIQTMHEYASETQEARELLSDLEYLWDQVKDIEPSTSPSAESTEPLDNMSAAIAAAGLFGYTGSNAGSYASFDPRLRGGTRGGAGSSVSGPPPQQQLLESYGRRSVAPSTAGGSYVGVVGQQASAGGQSAATAAGAASADRGRKARHPVDRSRVFGAGGSTTSSTMPLFEEAAVDPENQEMKKWRRDVTWALETINEEIMAMRHRYAAVASGTAVTDAGSMMNPPPVPGPGEPGEQQYQSLLTYGARGPGTSSNASHRQTSLYSYNDKFIDSGSRNRGDGGGGGGGLPVLLRRRLDESTHHLNRSHEMLSSNGSSHHSEDSQVWTQSLRHVVSYVLRKRLWRVLARVLWGVGKHIVTDLVVLQAVLILVRSVRGSSSSSSSRGGGLSTAGLRGKGGEGGVGGGQQDALGIAGPRAGVVGRLLEYFGHALDGLFQMMGLRLVLL